MSKTKETSKIKEKKKISKSNTYQKKNLSLFYSPILLTIQSFMHKHALAVSGNKRFRVLVTVFQATEKACSAGTL